MNFLSEQYRNKKEKTIILMDNASSHRAKTVKEFLDSRGAHVVFIPPYSPVLVPVEKYFGVLKDLVRKDKTTTVIK